MFSKKKNGCHNRGLFIETRRGLKAIRIQEKSKLILLVQVRDRKFNPSKKMILNSSRFVVFYCEVILT
jgi:hypothetical protein